MSTNDPGAQNPNDPTSGQSGGQPPEQPGGPTYQPGPPMPPPGAPAPGPAPYAAGGVPPSAYPAPQPGMPYQQYPKNGLGVWSLVLGIVSWFVCPIIASIGAIVTGHMSRRAVREGLADNGGLGLAGLILGWASLVVGLVLTIVVVVAFGALVSDPNFQEFIENPTAFPTIDSDY